MIDPSERTFTRKEAKKFFSCVDDPRYLTMFKLMYYSGLRVGEALKIRLKDINFSECCVYTRVEKKKCDIRLRNYFPRNFRADLKAYVKLFNIQDYIFPNQYGKSLSSQNTGDAFRKALNKCGLNRSYTVLDDGRRLNYFTTHSLRKSFVSSVEEVSSLHLASKCVHHESIETTRKHYSSITRERKVTAIEKAFEEF